VNAKMSDIHAALGLSVLPYFDEIKVSRKKIVSVYIEKLKNFQRLKIRKGTKWNYSYFPIIFNSEKDLLKVKNALNHKDIFPRRYFYPSLNKLPYLDYQSCPISEDISNRVICLPLYHDLKIDKTYLICEIINSAL
jgi:dTDP-4-amino-4,6-dideoxygalactose transaminase